MSHSSHLSQVASKRDMGLLLDLAKEGPGPGAAAVTPGRLPDYATAARPERLVDMLEAQPSARYAVFADDRTFPEAVIIGLAIRSRATCELRIPRDKWDGVLFLESLERHLGTVR